MFFKYILINKNIYKNQNKYTIYFFHILSLKFSYSNIENKVLQIYFDNEKKKKNFHNLYILCNKLF